MQRILHTPEGVRDIYGRECEQKLSLQDRLHAVIRSYGYRDIETPTFEFFDVFSKEIGTIPSAELYKFFDREGNTLVLRPDFTPPVARAASKYFLNSNVPVRLTYLGQAFVNNSSYQGRLKETTQIGGELMGEDSVDADAEIVSLAVQMMLASGLKEFQITLGHAGFFHALAQEAGFDAQVVAELKELVTSKNTFGVDKLVSAQTVSEPLAKAFTALTGLFGTEDMLTHAEGLTDNPHALSAVARLREVWEVLKLYGVEKYVSFDLGMLSRYMYYTGIIFRGYTYGIGDAVIKGGRYDNLLGYFGQDAPSVGFVVVVDQLLSALARQKTSQHTAPDRCVILYDDAHRTEAVRQAAKLRGAGKNAELLRVGPGRTPEECREYAQASDCESVIELLRVSFT